MRHRNLHHMHCEGSDCKMSATMLKTTAASTPTRIIDLCIFQDLSDGYGESFEEFEDDDAPSDPPQATSKQQLQQGDSEAQRFRNKAEKMLRENEEKERSQGASNHALSREEGVDGTSGAVRDNQSPETDSTKVQQAEDGQFLRDDDGERVHDADVLKEREAEGERRLRQAEEEQAREKEAERRVLDKNETTRAEQMETEGGDDGDQRNGDTPTRIGEYNVECLLGDGAYGWVYKCRKRPRQGRSGETLRGATVDAYCVFLRPTVLVRTLDRSVFRCVWRGAIANIANEVTVHQELCVPSPPV